MSKRTRKLIDIVFSALEDGPGTSSEVSAETGIPIKVVSATMNELRQMGVVKKAGFVREEVCNRKAFIWAKSSDSR